MKRKNYSKDIANEINAFLTKKGWHFTFDEEQGLFKFTASIEGPLERVHCKINVMEDEYIVKVVPLISPYPGNERLISTMAKFICQVNHDIAKGNFQLNQETGELRFQYYVDCAGVIPSEDTIKDSILYPIVMFRHYGVGFVGIIYWKLSAEEAYLKCEFAEADRLRDKLQKNLDESGEMKKFTSWLGEQLPFDHEILQQMQNAYDRTLGKGK